MEEFKITIAEDFSNTPGGRWERLGPHSGEEFYNTLLFPRYQEAIKAGKQLHIYLDGVKSYPSSFLDQSFGELGRAEGENNVNSIICFHTSNFEWVIDCIKNQIWFKK